MTSGWSRRQMLGGLAGVGALWSLDGRADGPAPLGTATLADPDFDRLRAVSPYVVGVRPHRVGGVRLELEAEPLAGPAGLRNLIHNYGHGGAGITLAWGCAAAATGLVAEAMARLPADEAPQIAIVGTGVIGLTTATEIRRRWPTVPITVYAKDLDLRATTSYLAGGQFEPSGVWREYTDPARKEVLASYLRASRDRLLELYQSSDAYGVLPRLNYALDHEIPSIDTYTPADVVPTYKTGPLPFARLNVVGREYQTWLVNPTILLPKLTDELAAAGVCFEQRAFGSRADLGAVPQNIVVNCTGYGAKALVGDDKVVAQRGHLVVLDKTSELQNYLFSGGCENRVVSYVFCRQTDIVVGGTIFRGEDSAAISPADAAVFAKVLANARSVFAGHPEVCRA